MHLIIYYNDARVLSRCRVLGMRAIIQRKCTFTSQTICVLITSGIYTYRLHRKYEYLHKHSTPVHLIQIVAITFNFVFFARSVFSEKIREAILLNTFINNNWIF